MVNEVPESLKGSFNSLLTLMQEEAAKNKNTAMFLKYIIEKGAFMNLNAGTGKTAGASEIKECIRGITRYADEFEFSDSNDQKIRGLLHNLYDQAVQL